MKLLRWSVAGAAGASVYAIYRYSIGKKAKGEDVFTSAERAIAKLTGKDVDVKKDESEEGTDETAEAAAKAETAPDT